ncbi:MAG: glutaminase domain-containing protein [Phycisphaeraceae bacterium]
MDYQLRPPAVPLVVCDPFFSIWAFGDTLHAGQTRHWTGAEHPLVALVRVDGETFRLVGGRPSDHQAMAQTSLAVWPTRTVATFEGAGVAVELEFATPAIADDLDLLARPVTWVTWRVRSTTGEAHEVQLYFEVWPEVAVDSPAQKVTWHRPRVKGLDVLACGSSEQDVLGKIGDDVRIDWGYFYLAAEQGQQGQSSLVPHPEAHRRFLDAGELPREDSLDMPLAPNDWRNVATLGMSFDLGEVGGEPIRRRAILAYDDRFSAELLHRRLRPYWRRTGWNAAELLRRSATEADALIERCRTFDENLFTQLVTAGGQHYAELCSLAYRQATAAHKLAADTDGAPLFLSKENFSNGCMATVDVAYPALPFYAQLNPALLEAALRPVCEYAESPRWPFPFAPHDLGRYPKANGQVYGGGERDEENQMPVEECGNMLIMIAALARATGSAAFAQRYWPLVEQWADYLAEKGFDPENQLCTDDFMGHLAHNANLSIKAIVALGSAAMLAAMRDLSEPATRYRTLAERFARSWLDAAAEGDHTRLAFDQEGTWSQKYNLAWDRLLGLDLFPAELAQREVAFYKTQLNPFGLPLDSRGTLAKLDWCLWTATLAESDADWQALFEPIYHWANTTPDRVPLADAHWSDTGKHRNFRARSVVGGVFIKLLAETGLGG